MRIKITGWDYRKKFSAKILTDEKKACPKYLAISNRENGGWRGFAGGVGRGF